MSETLDQTVTRLLGAAGDGQSHAARELIPILYDELRRLARAKLAGAPGQTLQPTALVNEVFVRLVSKTGVTYDNRKHFFFAAARAMHDILVEQARRRASLKRGGDRARVDAGNLEDATAMIQSPADDILALSEALKELEEVDADKARLVMLRYFAGMTMEEVSSAMEVPQRTLEREWRFVRAWLHAKLTGSLPGDT